MCTIPERNQVLIYKYIKKLFYKPKRYGGNTCLCCLGKTYFYTDCRHSLCSNCFDSLKGDKIWPKCRKDIAKVSKQLL